MHCNVLYWFFFFSFKMKFKEMSHILKICLWQSMSILFILLYSLSLKIVYKLSSVTTENSRLKIDRKGIQNLVKQDNKKILPLWILCERHWLNFSKVPVVIARMSRVFKKHIFEDIWPLLLNTYIWRFVWSIQLTRQ